MEPQSRKFKEGDRVRVKSAGIEGYIVKIYFDRRVNSDVYVICKVDLDVPPLGEIEDIKQALAYIRDLPKNIQTRLKCTTVKLDSEDEMEKI